MAKHYRQLIRKVAAVFAHCIERLAPADEAETQLSFQDNRSDAQPRSAQAAGEGFEMPGMLYKKSYANRHILRRRHRNALLANNNLLTFMRGVPGCLIFSATARHEGQRFMKQTGGRLDPHTRLS